MVFSKNKICTIASMLVHDTELELGPNASQRQFQSCQVTQAGNMRGRAAMSQLSFCAEQ